VVFAAAKGANSGVSDQRLKGLAVLYAPEVTGKVFPGLNVIAIFRSITQAVDGA
jgi:hypothetical protein